jgi:hypothetical protein
MGCLSVLQKVLALRADLAADLIDRAEAIDAALLALVTREHLLLLGSPDTTNPARPRWGET